MERKARRLALLLEYDGTGYVGSQLQMNGPSIQFELERAIAELTGVVARVAFAGRTDAGVHALGQVAAFETRAPYPPAAIRGGLNVRLAPAIAVRAVADVSLDFDPRRWAVARRYQYTVVSSPVRSPLLSGHAWHVKAMLDVSLMRKAAALLLGEHDFAPFGARATRGASTRREVRAIEIVGCGRVLTLEMEANAFLMHQVRRTAAALVEVGTGKRGIAEFERIFRSADPGAFEGTAPSHGLCLMHVRYAPAIFDQE